MLISTALTFLSDIRILNALRICSAFAPPPTSRKLAGSPPASLMMSIVAIARPAPLTMQPIVAVEADVVQRELRGFDFERIFFRRVAQILEGGVAKERVVVEGDLRVEREQVAARGDDERVDFDHRRVGGDEGVVEGGEHLDALVHLGALEADREGELAGLEGADADRRVDVFADGSGPAFPRRPFRCPCRRRRWPSSPGTAWRDRSGC